MLAFINMLGSNILVGMNLLDKLGRTIIFIYTAMKLCRTLYLFVYRQVPTRRSAVQLSVQFTNVDIF